MGRPGEHNRPWWRATGRRGSMVAITGLLAVAAIGCGQGSEPELGTGIVGPTTMATTTTVPASTTTTVDFSRPITQGLTPLAEDAGLIEVTELVADMRGQSDDVAAQVQRLAPFLDLSPAPVAQILGVDITLSEVEEGRYPATVTVRLRVPDTGPDLVAAIDDEFTSLGWFTNSVSRREVDGGTATDAVFRNPGIDPDDL